MMINGRLFAALLFAPGLLSAQASAQTIATNAAHARAVLDAAVAAHGGQAALREARRIRVTLEGRDLWRNQSARIAPPYDARPSTLDLMLDVAASRMVQRTTSAYPGDLTSDTRRVTNGDRAFRVFEQLGAYSMDRAMPIANILPYLNLPQLALLAAMDASRSLRSLGRIRLASGAAVDAILVNAPDAQLTLGFDPATKHLRAILNAGSDPLTGDSGFETEFLDYRMLNGVLMPTRRVTWNGGEMTQELRYTSTTPNYTIPDSVLALPSGLTEITRGAPRERVVTHAPGVWSIWAGGWVLAVAFNDHVVVIEAPGGATSDVLAAVEKLAPEKPVRYVVPTHHHDDHSSGIRGYVARGITIVTTPGNRAYFERMAAARSILNPDAQDSARRAPTFEVITGGRRVFTDGTRTLEIRDVGPNLHANELLAAWVPDAGVVFEADMINTSPTGDVLKNSNMVAAVDFARRIKTLGWPVRTYAGMHHPPVDASVLDAIVAQPVRPK